MRNQKEQECKVQIREVKKSNLSADSFDYKILVKVGRDFITRGLVDGKRIYHLERRGIFGELEQSNSFFNIKTLKKSIRR